MKEERIRGGKKKKKERKKTEWLRERASEREREEKKTYVRCYSTIIKVRRYCSSIGKIFTILSVYNSGWWRFLRDKC